MTWKIGHRGVPHHAAENTLLAMEKAIELGMDALECDVHLCKSGEVIVMHDETLDRTTNGKGRLANHTLEQIRQLRINDGQYIPTLEELMERIDGLVPLYIELKDPAAAEATAALISKYAPTYDEGYSLYPVISFNRDALLRVKKADASILAGMTTPPEGAGVAFVEEAAQLGMWSVNPCIDTLEESFMVVAKAHGLKVITWTANAPEKIARAYALGVDGIISDYPERL